MRGRCPEPSTLRRDGRHSRTHGRRGPDGHNECPSWRIPRSLRPTRVQCFRSQIEVHHPAIRVLPPAFRTVSACVVQLWRIFRMRKTGFVYSLLSSAGQGLWSVHPRWVSRRRAQGCSAQRVAEEEKAEAGLRVIADVDGSVGFEEVEFWGVDAYARRPRG